jgi:hypothetical protein
VFACLLLGILGFDWDRKVLGLKVKARGAIRVVMLLLSIPKLSYPNRIPKSQKEAK